jgi:hypothetical protein
MLPHNAVKGRRATESFLHRKHPSAGLKISAISKRGLKDVIVGGRINFSGGAKIAGAPRSQISTRSTTTLHFGAATCSNDKILERAEIETVV